MNSAVLNGDTQTVMENTKLDDGMRTPTMRSDNVADAFDWQLRANVAEHELMIQQSKLAREKGKNWRLRSQLISNIKGWTITSQHVQGLINSNYGYSQEVLRLKYTIEALEAMIQRLLPASRFIDDRQRMSAGHVTGEV